MAAPVDIQDVPYSKVPTAIEVGSELAGKKRERLAFRICVPASKRELLTDAVDDSRALMQHAPEHAQQRRRWAAFKELRALSAMLFQTTGLGLKDYTLQENIIASRVKAGESREMVGEHLAYRTMADGTRNPELPLGFDAKQDVHILNITVDKGPIGMGGLLCARS